VFEISAKELISAGETVFDVGEAVVGGTSPKDALKKGIAALAKDKRVAEQLRRMGVQIADNVWEKIVVPRLPAWLGGPVAKPAKDAKPAPAPEPSVVDMVKPLIDPFVSGLKDRLKERSAPLVQKITRIAAGALIATHLGAFFVGRFFGKRATAVGEAGASQ
jgi:hypothetical protein